MVPFLCFEQVEEEMRQEKERQMTDAKRFSKMNDIRDILNPARSKEYIKRLKLVISTTHGSLEVLDRVCMVLCPDQKSWIQRYNSIQARKIISDFLIDPTKYPVIPWYIRERFKIPANWKDRMDNKELYGNLQALYNTKIGLALESQITNTIANAGYQHDKGFVSLVDEKEVDVIVPSTNSPCVLIMASYNLTTSSSQSQRAREQKAMYEYVQRYNSGRARQDMPDVQLVNVIDGGGWLSRSMDLKVLHQHCDYILSAGQLNMLIPILKYHVR